MKIDVYREVDKEEKKKKNMKRNKKRKKEERKRKCIKKRRRVLNEAANGIMQIVPRPLGDRYRRRSLRRFARYAAVRSAAETRTTKSGINKVK